MVFPRIGMRVHSWEEGRVELHIDAGTEHLNLAGVIHGGVCATLVDVAGAMAGTHCAYPGRVRKAVTLSITTTYTGQAGEGLLRAVGVRKAGGRKIYNSVVEVFSADGRLLAFGEGTFRLRSGSEDPRGVPLES